MLFDMGQKYAGKFIFCILRVCMDIVWHTGKNVLFCAAKNDKRAHPPDAKTGGFLTDTPSRETKSLIHI